MAHGRWQGSRNDEPRRAIVAGLGGAVTQDVEPKLAVFGLGHVGLPTALGLAELGWHVIGAEDDRDKADRIARGEVPFFEPGVEDLLKKHLDTGRFEVRLDTAAAIRGSSVLFLCVGTPQREDGAADLSQLEGISRSIASNLNGYKLIVEKSTTPVRTAMEIKKSIQRHMGSEASTLGEGRGLPDFDVAVNPEFLREGKALHDFFNPDRIVLGVDSDRAARLLITVYRPLLASMDDTEGARVVVTDVNTAEIIKHASNAFLATKVSFINMVADLCEATGADIGDVAHGLGMDPRIGPQFLNAGIGYGGYCLPKDIRAFTWIASEHGVDFSMLKEVERVNVNRVERFVSRVRQALWVVKGKTMAVWGLAFKPGTDDVREAPSIAVVQRLLDEGARLRLYDPEAMDEFRLAVGESPPGLTYCGSAEEAAAGAEAILLLTEWDEFGEAVLSRARGGMAAPVIVDGRNHLDPEAARQMGFEYHSIGRP